jgi:3-isopropylmalate/(R)-2-methylmalate dehydratase small subunit
MAKYTSFSSRVVPLVIDNVDTDQIIPARFLKATDKKGFGEKLFADWRYNSDGSAKNEFPLNDPKNAGAELLLAGDNFGCGSSREHAPWALTSFGFRAVVSTSFADIFCCNALKNGLLPIVVSPADHKRLQQELQHAPDARVTVDLEKQQMILASGITLSFPIDLFSKFCLLNGVDELEYLRKFTLEIEAYESAQSR